MRLRGHGSFPKGFARNTNRPEARAEQIVGRERRERVSQLAWYGGGCLESRRRVNSDVIHRRFWTTGKSKDVLLLVEGVTLARDAIRLWEYDAYPVARSLPA